MMFNGLTFENAVASKKKSKGLKIEEIQVMEIIHGFFGIGGFLMLFKIRFKTNLWFVFSDIQRKIRNKLNIIQKIFDKE